MSKLSVEAIEKRVSPTLSKSETTLNFEVQRSPTMIASNVQPDGLLGHIGGGEYLVIPDPLLFVLAATQRIFAATVGQIAGRDDHLRSNDVDHFGTKRPEVFLT